MMDVTQNDRVAMYVRLFDHYATKFLKIWIARCIASPTEFFNSILKVRLQKEDVFQIMPNTV